MFEQSADSPKSKLAQPRVLITCEERFFALPQRKMNVHAAAVVFKDGFRHEGNGLFVPLSDVLCDVLVPQHLVAHLNERREAHIDLRLTGRCHFMVVSFDSDAHFHHLAHHLRAQVVIGIRRAYREVPAFVARFVA